MTSLTTPSSIHPAAPRGLLRALWRVPRFFGRAAWSLGMRFERQWQNVLTALVQVWVNKARALLTTLGIIIAVTSTITVVSLVQGFGTHITDMLRGFGTNMIYVIPTFPSGVRGRMLGRVTMDVQDIRAVTGRCDKVRRISPIAFLGGTIEYGREKVENISIEGVTAQYQSIRNFYVEKGRFFGPLDVDQGAFVCVLGREVLKRLECDDRIVGGHVYIEGLRFKVLGILEAKGQMMDQSQDEIIMMPYTTSLKLAPFFRTWLPFVIEATSEADVDEGALQVTRVLRAQHGIEAGEPNDFRLLRQDEFLRDFEKVTNIVTGILAGIVGVSLIVGGIGIMNVMLVSVTERTREIGLRKSVGARRRDILMQFLVEAVVLASLGGVVGIALSYAIGTIASQHPDMVEIVVPIWVVVTALGFSAVVGVVFGMIPAFKAAILHPIDALRHE